MTQKLGATMPLPRRLICVAVLALAVATAAFVAPAAQAAPYLGGGEARAALGRALHRDSQYGAVTGSLRARCYRARINVIRCAISFQDLDGDYWCGPASVRETSTSYRYWWDLHLC
jgi:hypothetical protein